VTREEYRNKRKAKAGASFSLSFYRLSTVVRLSSRQSDSGVGGVDSSRGWVGGKPSVPGAACSALGGSGGAPRVVLLGRGSSFPLPPPQGARHTSLHSLLILYSRRRSGFQCTAKSPVAGPGAPRPLRGSKEERENMDERLSIRASQSSYTFAAQGSNHSGNAWRLVSTSTPICHLGECSSRGVARPP